MRNALLDFVGPDQDIHGEHALGKLRLSISRSAEPGGRREGVLKGLASAAGQRRA
jgi:hypothetical protein